MTKEEVVGKKFNKLTVAGWKRVKGVTMLLCQCECGVIKHIQYSGVTNGTIKSCGCHRDFVRRTKSLIHGQSKSRIYRSWGAMKKRCYNPNDPAFHNYGGRGIKVCNRWQDFSNFVSDMGPRPEGYSIERIDVNGNYEPGNCAWIPNIEQAKNRRDTIHITLDGITKTLVEWCQIKAFSARIVYGRLNHGWPHHMLFEPKHTKLHPDKLIERKLDAAKADEIRKMYRDSGLPQWAIAKQFGVTQTMVSCIVTGKSW